MTLYKKAKQKSSRGGGQIFGFFYIVYWHARRCCNWSLVRGLTGNGAALVYHYFLLHFFVLICFCHERPHLEFWAKLRICQFSACKMKAGLALKSLYFDYLQCPSAPPLSICFSLRILYSVPTHVVVPPSNNYVQCPRPPPLSVLILEFFTVSPRSCCNTTYKLCTVSIRLLSKYMI